MCCGRGRLSCARRGLATSAAIQGSDDGDRQMVKVLSAVLTDGLAALRRLAARHGRSMIAAA